MIGLLGTNPEGWRLEKLSSSLRRHKVSHRPLYPWLFSTHIHDGSVEYHYDSVPLTGPSAQPSFDLIYVIALGFEDLQEVLYKLRLLRELRSAGTRIINKVETIETCRNKVNMTLRMASKGVKMPKTMITESVHLALDFVRENRPCVLKPITGLQGRGLIMIPAEMREGDMVDYISWFQAKHGRDVIYIQEFIDHPNYDIRALVVGGEVVSKMRRFNPEGWKTNIAAGAQPLPSEDDIDGIALEAAEAVGGEVVGVDVLPSTDGEFFVLEVNAFPGWKGLQEVTRDSIADGVANYLLSLT